MSEATGGYCVDTSALIRLWHEYEPEVMQGLWDRIDDLISAGRFWVPKDVVIEIPHRDGEGLAEWLDDRKRAQIDLDPSSWAALEQVSAQFPNWVNPKTKKNAADPVVVAHAIARKLIVVSEETASRSPNDIKIPTVCSMFGVKHVRLPGFFRSIELRL